MQIELTEAEGQDLVTLLDVAVKSGGLAVAQSALFFFGKLKEAANAPAPVTEEEDDGDV